MITIEPDDFYKFPTWLDTEFPALIIDDFINEKEAKDLEVEGEDFIKTDIKSNNQIHGGRVMIPWTSTEFQKLISKSHAWKKLSENFHKDAFNILKEKINSFQERDNLSNEAISELRKSEITVLNRYKLSPKININNLYSRYREMLELNCRIIPPWKLVIISLIRIIDSSWRRLVSLIDLLLGSKPLLPLFDYSFSKVGYSREIHRDSDNRLIVVLLYLNSLDNQAIGGDLELYKLKNSSNYKVNDYPPQPDKNQCELQYTIKPRRGRMVIFLNQFNSYHGVSKMIKNKISRHFIYGGYTFPSSIFNQSKRLEKSFWKTEMHIY